MSTPPKRILFARAADVSNVNAQAKNVQNILRRWKSAEYRPSVFSFTDPDPEIVANPNVDIIHIRDDRLWRAQVFARYWLNFDAVFCPGIHHIADWFALRTREALWRHLPIIATSEGLGSIETDDEFERRYAAVVGHRVFGQQLPAGRFSRYRWLIDQADHVIAISPFLGRQMEAQVGNKVSVLPLGVDPLMFIPPNDVRRPRLRVTCAGNVRSHKRPELFIELARKFPDADFVWFGEGDLRTRLNSEAKSRGLRNLCFPGPLLPDQLATEFARSDIFVLTSRGEGVPKVTQEAASIGLPQIVFGFYEAPTVVDGRNGFVVWSDEQFGERLAQLLDDAGLRERMGRAGAEMARDWSWDIVAPRWEQRIIETVHAAIERRARTRWHTETSSLAQ